MGLAKVDFVPFYVLFPSFFSLSCSYPELWWWEWALNTLHPVAARETGRRGRKVQHSRVWCLNVSLKIPARDSTGILRRYTHTHTHTQRRNVLCPANNFVHNKVVAVLSLTYRPPVCVCMCVCLCVCAWGEGVSVLVGLQDQSWALEVFFNFFTNK